MSTDNRVELQQAYLLHRKPYRDSSLLVDLFTRNYGRIGAVAKGARGTRSKLKGALQPYHALLVGWVGRGELFTLTGAETHGQPLFLQDDILLSGFYVNELMMRMLARNDPHPHIFDSYAATILKLADGNSIDWTLRIFERDLLQALGYGLLLTHEAESGERVQPDQFYCYDHEAGPRQVKHRERNNRVYHGATLLALADGYCDDADIRKECKWLMRDVLSRYLGSRPLASRELFIQKRL